MPKGVAWGWWKKHANYVLVATPPATPVNLDVSAFNAKLTPGYAYTVTLSPSGSGVAVASYATLSASKSAVALDTGQRTLGAGAGRRAQPVRHGAAHALDGLGHRVARAREPRGQQRQPGLGLGGRDRAEPRRERVAGRRAPGRPDREQGAPAA